MRISTAMAFDRDQAKALLCDLNDQVFIKRKLFGVKSRAKDVASATGLFGSAEETYGHINHLPQMEMSNHGKLISEAVEDQMSKIMTELVQMIAQSAPILASQRLEVDVILGLPKFKAPHLKMLINDIPLGGRGDAEHIDDCISRLGNAMDRIKHVEPGIRSFEFQGWHTIKAATPEGAYRTYAALAYPGMFEPEIAEKAIPIPMAETLETDAYQAALLAA